MNEYFILQLLHKQFTGEIAEGDQKLLFDWENQSKENKSFSDTVQKIWEISANYQPPVSFESRVDSAFSRFQQKIQEDKNQNAEARVVSMSQQKDKSFGLRRVLPWIASTAAVVALTFFGMQLINADNNPVFESVNTIADHQEELKLEDGSLVFMNEKSSFSFFVEKSSDRKTVLNGEAFFDVEKGDEPFIVETPNATVTVLGTEFNVDANDQRTKVHVKEGRVELRPLNSSKSIVLEKNMTGVYNVETQKLYKKQSKVYNGDSWRRNAFSFEAALLSEVFETLQDHYDVDIYVENQEILQCPFTSPVYQDVTLKAVMDVMSTIYLFDYHTDENGRIIIEGGVCN